MRLTPDEIEFIARKIVKTLVKEGKLEIDSEPRVEMERSNMSYTEMFKMLKKKMAKEKGIVL
jgi:hypothetical protein